MQAHRPLRTPALKRRGFTLIELLVVISIIATLAALLLPAIQQARETARRTQCLNNMRNVNIATQSFATAQNGKLPPLVSNQTMAYYIPGTPPAVSGDIRVPWVVSLFPYLEQGALYERLLAKDVNKPADPIALAILNCPNDPNRTSNANLSFAANAGYAPHASWATADSPAVAAPYLYAHRIDNYTFSAITSNADNAELINSTGLFFPLIVDPANSVTAKPITLDQVSSGDGTTQTLLVTENLQADSWISTNIKAFSVMVPIHGTAATAAAKGAFSNYGSNVQGIGPATNTKEYSLRLEGTNSGTFSLALPGTNDGRINNNVSGATEAGCPRPSSLHAGVVNAMFAGGNGKTISQDISDRVYAELYSWNGKRFGQPILSDESF